MDVRAAIGNDSRLRGNQSRPLAICHDQLVIEVNKARSRPVID